MLIVKLLHSNITHLYHQWYTCDQQLSSSCSNYGWGPQHPAECGNVIISIHHKSILFVFIIFYITTTCVQWGANNAKSQKKRDSHPELYHSVIAVPKQYLQSFVHKLWFKNFIPSQIVFHVWKQQIYYLIGKVSENFYDRQSSWARFYLLVSFENSAWR